MTTDQMSAKLDIVSSAKDVLAIAASRSSRPIIVNSFGRSGSTVLFNAVSRAASRFGEFGARHVVRGYAWDLSRQQLGTRRCYKSHDYPSPTLRSDARVLYVFANPIAATYSLINRVQRSGPEWLDEHCKHLRAEKTNVGSLGDRDALDVAGHLRAWLTQETVQTAFVQYESLWELEKEISDFLGFEVLLPPQRARSSTGDAISPKMEAAYQEAIQIVDSLPKWSVHN